MSRSRKDAEQPSQRGELAHGFYLPRPVVTLSVTVHTSLDAGVYVGVTVVPTDNSP